MKELVLTMKLNSDRVILKLNYDIKFSRLNSLVNKIFRIPKVFL